MASWVTPEQSAGCAICAPRKELPPWEDQATCKGEGGRGMVGRVLGGVCV